MTCLFTMVAMVIGTVIRTGQVNMLESRRNYRCDKCHHQCVVKVTENWGGCYCAVYSERLMLSNITLFLNLPGCYPLTI